MGNEHGKTGGAAATPAGIQSMDEALQKRFAKGIQFNMKIVLKGDRNTGKTCLFNRMAGKPFQEAYIPTMEIQVTSILWSYKVTSDTVKVEVWDVVDKGKVQKKETKGGLKIFNTTPDVEEDEGEGEGGKKILDATFLNVYKGCNGVVLVFDMTKMWTWKYVERELPKIPFDIPVIVLGNFKDLGEHRVITRDEIRVFLDTARPDGSSEVMYSESSMKNAFGLMHLHKFLSIPFLQMQQDMLLQQIQVSREQMLAAREELITASSTEDQNYDMFVARLQQAAELRKKAQQQREEESELTETGRPGGGMDHERSSIRSSSSASSSTHPQQQTTPTQGITVATAAEQQQQQPSTAKRKSRLSNFFSSSKNKEQEHRKDSIPVSGRGASVSTTTDIEEFVPEGDVDSFLEEGEGGEEADDGGESEEEEEEEEGEAHPVIAGDEDLSSPDEEEETATPPSPPKPRVSQEQSPAAVKCDAPSSSSFSSPLVRRDDTSTSPPLARRDKTVKPLKSAKEVELTESEEEEEEEEEEQTVPRSTTRVTQKDLELFWGNLGPKDGGGEEEEEEAKPKAKPKSGGLLLEWRVPEAAAKPSKKKESPKGSPEVSEGRKERRRKSSKKGSSSSSRRKKEAAASGSSGTTAANDPFGATALDAWLNSEDILQPTVTKGGGEVGEEAGEEAVTSSSSHKKTKKHRDRTSSSDGTRHKKKHKSRHSAKDTDQTF